MTASSVPTLTVSPSWTLISLIVPATGEGTSVSTLSVEISNSGSLRSTSSPSLFSHLTMVPSTTVSPSWGIFTGVGTSTSSSHRVQRLAGQVQVGLADRLGQRRVGMDQGGHLRGEGLPIRDQHGLGHQVGDVGTDQVDAQDRAVLLRHHLARSSLADDVGLSQSLHAVPV